MLQPPNRQCGTGEPPWPRSQVLCVWDMSWPSDLKKPLNLQEPGLMWDSNKAASDFLLTSSSHSGVRTVPSLRGSLALRSVG